MKRKKIPLYDLKIPAVAIREATGTLKSGWLSTGPNIKAFERAVARMNRVRHAAAVNSATAGLVTTLNAIDVRNREVVTTPFTFVATAEAILQAGALPVFADIDPVTLNLDPEQLQQKLSSNTAGIIPVDIAGYPADYDAIGGIAREFELPLIADASHALGATYQKKSIPQLSDAAIFSFHATKNLTCGEGGMVVTQHKALADRVRLLSRHGMSATAYQRRGDNAWAYDVTALGQKATMSELHAAIGLSQVPGFRKSQEKRRKLGERYLTNLAELSDFVEPPPSEKHIKPAWHLFIIKLNLARLTVDRNEFIRRMAARGVECGVHFIPLYEFTFYRDMGLTPAPFPNTAGAAARVVTLPLYPGLKLTDVDYVCEAIEKVCRSVSR